MSKLLLLLRWFLVRMRHQQADNSYYFRRWWRPWRDVSPRVYTIHKFSLFGKFAYMAIYHRIDQNILSRKSSHKDTPISVLFWTLSFGKLIYSVDPQVIRAFVSSSGNNCGNICRYTYHLNKSLQGFVQRKLDRFEIKLTLFVIICNCGTYNFHFPFVAWI